VPQLPPPPDILVAATDFPPIKGKRSLERCASKLREVQLRLRPASETTLHLSRDDEEHGRVDVQDIPYKGGNAALMTFGGRVNMAD